MALRAIPGPNRRVFAGAFLEGLVKFPVAGKADSSLSVHEHAGIVAAVNVVTGETHPGCEGHMVGTALGFCHKIAMALAAEIRAGSLEDFLFVRTVGVMTGIATAVSDRFVGVGLEKPYHGIRVTGVADRVHSFLKQKLEIRAVRIMTGYAHFLHKRRMGHLCALGFLRLYMALKAQCPSLCTEKLLILRSMGKMAGKASPFADDRRMLVRHIFTHCRMAVEAENIAGLAQKLWAFRGMGGMA
jgi:hypothetical protein